MPTEAPPAAPPAEASPPPAPNAAPTPELHVTTASVVDKGPAQPPPRKGSVREQMFQDLRKKAGAEEDEPAKPAETKPSPEPEASPADGKTSAGEGAPADKKKVSPWKLVDEFKSRAAELEKQLAETRKSVPDPKEREQMTAKLTAAEQRMKELEDEIRFVNYQKHPEFVDKYQKPYEEAWKKWMGDLRELTVPAADGQERPIEPGDLLQLVRMPLKEARKAAEEIFGDFADDVMDARKEISNLFDAQQKALEEARKNGETREQERQKAIREAQQNFQKTIGEMWKRSNDEMAKDEKTGRFLRPVEGDEEGNKRLARGFELADKAFSANLYDPKLTPEERASVVKLHSAIRNRAAAAGRLILWNEKLTAELQSLKAELAKYKSAEPGMGEGKKPESAAAPSSARDQLFGALRKIAH